MGSMIQNAVQESKKGIGATIKGGMAGVSAWGNATRQRIQAYGLADQSAISADQIRTNKILQARENQSAMDELARQKAAVTESYNQVQGSNLAEMAAGNVDVSSGSAAQIQNANAMAYANDAAQARYAEQLQQWQGESTLSMMEAQAKGYDKISSAQRSIGNMINPFASGLGTGLLTGLSSYFSS